MAPAATLVNNSADSLKQRKKVVSKSKPADFDPVINATLKDYRKNYVPPPAELLKKVRDAIPKHCFQRNVFTSLSYVLRDFTMAAILFYGALHIDTTLNGISPYLPYVAWPLYWWAQGAVCTGMWVLAHECGHRAFSNYQWVDHTVGYILHSALLVPFYSWKITHAHHHKLTCHLDEDSVFVPWTRSELKLPASQPGVEDGDDDHPLTENLPLMHLKSIVIMLLFGWPAYLIANVSGQEFDKWTSHFRPDAPIFEPSQYRSVVSSDIGVILALGALTYFSTTFGLLTVVKYYVIPYLFVNFWLVLITYLQHTDERVPHYRKGQFNFVRGALATVDRDYGILNGFFHHIADTHVVHHMFSQMPHYHAQEATEAAKKVLGEYYLYDDTNIFVSLWKSVSKCRFVEDEAPVLDDSAPQMNLKQRRALGASKTTTSTKQQKPQTVAEFRKNFKPAPPELLKKVRDAIPKRLFERNLIKSMSYVVSDLIQVAILAYFASHIDSSFASIHPGIPYIAWPIYWFFQGANHHKVTSHMKLDSVFIPYLRSEFKDLSEPTEDDLLSHGEEEPFLESVPLMHLVNLLSMLFLGWPAYLWTNLSGQKYEGKWVSHFRPDAAIFEPSQYFDIILSDIGLLGVLSVLTYCTVTFGFWGVFKYYLVPYLIVNFWLIIITFLQHTDERVPHYREKEFSFVRGALATVDRDFGFLNHMFHHITDTHVVHHMFSQLPFYNAQEATAIAREVLGEHYLSDDTNMFVALWNSMVNCRFVEDEGDIEQMSPAKYAVLGLLLSASVLAQPPIPPPKPALYPPPTQLQYLDGALLTDPLVATAYDYAQKKISPALWNLEPSKQNSFGNVTYPPAQSAPACHWGIEAQCVRTTATADFHPDVITCPKPYQWGITYDDGPNTQTTPGTSNVRAALKAANLKATFFVLGSAVALGTGREELKALYADGHQIAIHGWTHRPFTNLTNYQVIAELKYTESIIYDTIGVVPQWFRPPYGDIDDRVRAIATALGYNVAIWTTTPVRDTQDTITSYQAPGLILQNVTKWFTDPYSATSGFISLEHDVTNITASISVEIINAFRAANSQLKPQPVAECVGVAAYKTIPGTGTTGSNGTSTSSVVSPTTTGKNAGNVVSVSYCITAMTVIFTIVLTLI
ncbi:Delta(12)-fatty-acid desaturase [Nowakowskiella sp. JEL0407]|nr:Delta(12)-fatty-acid desaturase [Nowakowskiella sp. JEL0407]